MPGAEYLKNKSGDKFYPVVNVGSIIFPDNITYAQHKSKISDMIYDLAHTTDTYINPLFNQFSAKSRDYFGGFHKHNATDTQPKITIDMVGSYYGWRDTPAFLTETGVHGIRYYDKKLQLTLNGEWRDLANSKDSFKPAKVSKFKINWGHKVAYSKENAVGDLYSVLNWYDPDDVSNAVKWAGTKVYRICHFVISGDSVWGSAESIVSNIKALGSSILEDSNFKDYTVLLTDNKIKNRYATTKFVDDTIASFLDAHIDSNGAGDGIVVSTDGNSFSAYYLCIPYSEDGFDGTPTVFYYMPTNISKNTSDSVSRYCDFKNNQTYWVGQKGFTYPTLNDGDKWMKEYHEFIRDSLTTRYRCIVDPDGYILGFFAQDFNDWGASSSTDSSIKKQAVKVYSIGSGAFESFTPELYYDQWAPEFQDSNTPEVYISPFDENTPLGPNTSQDLTWLNEIITSKSLWSGWSTADASKLFGGYKGTSSATATTTIKKNCSIDFQSTSSNVVNPESINRFDSVTVPSSLTDGFTVYKWYYDETETGEYKWKSKSKTYAAGTVIPVDIMVICPLKFYKTTIISQQSISGAVLSAVYSLSNTYEDGYKPHPAFVYERNTSATTIKDSKPTITPYILTSAFPCTVFTGNKSDFVAGALNAPYYKSSALSTIGDTVTGWDTATWKSNSSSWDIRSVPNTPPTVMANPTRIEDLANQKSTDIKWRCIGYPQFALTEMMMLIEYGTTSVKNLLVQYPKINKASPQSANAKFDPVLWCFDDALPIGGVKLNPFFWNFKLSMGSEDYSGVYGQNRFSAQFSQLDWHNYNRTSYASGGPFDQSTYSGVYTKTSSHVIPGITWMMGSYSGFAAVPDLLCFTASPMPDSETSPFYKLPVTGDDELVLQGIAYSVNGLYTRGAPVYSGWYCSENIDVNLGFKYDVKQKTISWNTQYNCYNAATNNVSGDDLPGNLLVPVFTYAGEENFGWGNYTPFNSDVIASTGRMYGYIGRKYDELEVCITANYPTAYFDDIKNNPHKNILTFGDYSKYNIISGMTNDAYASYYGSSNTEDVAFKTTGYHIFKLPVANHFGAYGWCINHMMFSLDDSKLPDFRGDTSSILGVTMNARKIDWNKISIAACGYDGLALGAVGHDLTAAIDYSTYTVPYTASTDVTSTAELGNYQPRIYTYAQ